MRNGSTPVTDALVDFVLDLEPASLPAAVTEAASLCVMDWLGTAIRGSAEPLAGALHAVITASGGERQATVLGRSSRTSALLACLANGAQAHALDFDDTHIPSLVHGSAPVAPTVRGPRKQHQAVRRVPADSCDDRRRTRDPRTVGAVAGNDHGGPRDGGQPAVPW